MKNLQLCTIFAILIGAFFIFSPWHTASSSNSRRAQQIPIAKYVQTPVRDLPVTVKTIAVTFPKDRYEWSKFIQEKQLLSLKSYEVSIDRSKLSQFKISHKTLSATETSLFHTLSWLAFSNPEFTQTPKETILQYTPELKDLNALGNPFSETKFISNIKEQLGDDYETNKELIFGFVEAAKHNPLIRDFGREPLKVIIEDIASDENTKQWKVTEIVSDLNGNVVYNQARISDKLPYPYGNRFKIVEE